MNNPETEKAVEDLCRLSNEAIDGGACYECVARTMIGIGCEIIMGHQGDDAAVHALEGAISIIRGGKPSSQAN